MRRALLVLVLPLGCATAAGTVSSAQRALMSKAAFDLACSKNEIKLARLAADRVLVDVGTGRPVTRAAYSASGCGERVDYIVDCVEGAEGQSCTAEATRDVVSAFPPGAR